MIVDLGHKVSAVITADSLRGFLSSRYDGFQLRQMVREGAYVRGLYHLQKLVGGVVAQASHGSGGVIEGDAVRGAVVYNLLEKEGLALFVNEMFLVAIEDSPFDAPVVVDEVRVIEVAAPPFALRGKAAEEENTSVRRQKGEQRMIFYISVAPLYIFCVEK